MSKKASRGFKVFQYIQARKPAYLMSQLTPHEQALREDKEREKTKVWEKKNGRS